MTSKEAGRKGGLAKAAARRAAGLVAQPPYQRKRTEPTRPWRPPGPRREPVPSICPTIDPDELDLLEV